MAAQFFPAGAVSGWGLHPMKIAEILRHTLYSDIQVWIPLASDSCTAAQQGGQLDWIVGLDMV
jgi:hypothetical protein